MMQARIDGERLSELSRVNTELRDALQHLQRRAARLGAARVPVATGAPDTSTDASAGVSTGVHRAAADRLAQTAPLMQQGRSPARELHPYRGDLYSVSAESGGAPLQQVRRGSPQQRQELAGDSSFERLGGGLSTTSLPARCAAAHLFSCK